MWAENGGEVQRLVYSAKFALFEHDQSHCLPGVDLAAVVSLTLSVSEDAPKLYKLRTWLLPGMVKKVFIVDMREHIARGIWKGP